MVIIKTKVLPPLYDPRLLDRQALLQKLADWPDKKLILLSAEAGSGKTSLINVWLRAMREGGAPCKIAWYSLDEGDDDPARFFRYLLAALKEAGCFPSDIDLEWMTDVRNPSLTEAFSHLTNILIDEAGNQPLFIIFDDFHHLLAEEIQKCLDLFLRYLPTHIHLFILSRVDPWLNLPALRMKGQMIDIRSRDLTFGLDECREFLKNAAHTEIDEKTLALLYRRTEGWAAGVQMAALSLRNRQAPMGNLFEAESRLVIDYLMDEVYSRLSDHLKEFLLRTSILNRFTADLCRAVSGKRDSAELIATLRRENLFLIPLDPEENWFRYHRLFSELLRKRLMGEFSSEAAKLHLRAARWYRDQGLIQEAFDHALVCGDRGLLNGLAANYAEALWVGGEHTLLLGQLKRIPEAVLRGNPRLRLYLSWLKLISGKVEEALADITAVEDGLSDEEQGMLETIRAFYGNITSDPQAIEKHATRAIELLGDKSPIWRSSAVTVLGYAHWMWGNLRETEKYFRIALKESTLHQNTFFALLAGFNLALALRNQGRLEEAKALCHRQLGELETYGYSQPARTGGIYAILGQIAGEQNELDTALRFCAQGVELAEQGGNIPVIAISYLSLGAIYFARKEYDDAGMLLNKLIELKSPAALPRWMEAPIRVLQAALGLVHGKIEQALQLLGAEQTLALQSIPYAKEMEVLLLIRVLLSRGRADQAQELLDKLKGDLKPNHRWAAWLHCLISYSLLHECQNLELPAETSLRKALARGARYRFLRIFVEAGSALIPILKRLEEKSNLGEYGRQVLEAIQNDRSGAAGKPKPLLDPLSQRELEILRQLPQGTAYPDLADKLFISYSTVRSHVKSIYQKLGAHSRLEAINIAKGLGLLP